MKSWLKWTAIWFWRCNVRGTPGLIVMSAIALAATIWLQLPRWIICYDTALLILNLIAYDYRRRHGTLPENGIDDDLNKVLPPPPTKEK